MPPRRKRPSPKDQMIYECCAIWQWDESHFIFRALQKAAVTDEEVTILRGAAARYSATADERERSQMRAELYEALEQLIRS
jgi:hypothetical protein